MKEKDFLERVIEEELIQKDKIKKEIIYGQKEDNYMKRKWIAVASVLVIFIFTFAAFAYVEVKEYKEAYTFLKELGVEEGMLTRSETKKVYNDIKSNRFDEPVTNVVLSIIVTKLGVKNSSSNPKEIYETIKTYNKLTYTKKISSSDVRQIEAGMLYSDIIELLGTTKDLGKSDNHLLMYVVDGNKLLYLSFNDENDICNQSGDELLKTLVNSIQDDDNWGTFNATVVEKNNSAIFVICPTHERFDSIYLSIKDDTEILFENGSKASLSDVEGNIRVTIGDHIRESYPVQGDAKKIIILN